MKCSLFLIGETLNNDTPLQSYIARRIAAVGITPDRIFKSATAEILCTDLHVGTAEHRTILIYTDPGHASTVAREIATSTGDTVTMRSGLLLPSEAVPVEPGYYEITTASAQIHVIAAAVGRKLPDPKPGQTEKSAVTHLFDIDGTHLQTVLKQLSDAYRIRYTVSETIPGWLQCRMWEERFGDLEGAQQQLIAQYLTAVAADNIAVWLIETLGNAQKSVTFAESCTGGLLSYYLTKESGASGVFEGALVTYSNRLKASWIAVENKTLEAHGAVSREVVEEMSAGALEVAAADYAIAVSGVAGPTGGSPAKPVGTVQVAVRSKEELVTERLMLQGDRNYIQEQTVLHAVKMLLLLDKKTFFKIS